MANRKPKPMYVQYTALIWWFCLSFVYATRKGRK
jgi:hypothetical protein